MKQTLSHTTTLTSFLLAGGILIAGLSWEPAHAGKKVLTTNYPGNTCFPVKHHFQGGMAEHYFGGGIGNKGRGPLFLQCRFERKSISSSSVVYMYYEDNHPRKKIECRVQLVDPFGIPLRTILVQSKRGTEKGEAKTSGPGQGENNVNLRYSASCEIPGKAARKTKPSILHSFTIYEWTKTD